MFRNIWNQVKHELFQFGTILLSVLTLCKPVKRDRKLFGNNGGGMVLFALWIALLVPSIIFGVTQMPNLFDEGEVAELLLTNYDTDVSSLTGEVKEDKLTLKAEDNKPHHEEWWAILSQYTDPGNLPSAKNGDGGYILAVICAFAGIFCLSGLAVSSLVSFINRTTVRWRKGLLRYNLWFDKYVVIIGCNQQTAHLAKLMLKRPRDEVKYILIVTSQNVEDMRMKLDLDLDKDEEDRIVFYYAERTSREDIDSLHLEKAVDIFVLGEDVYLDREEDHDVYNISCLENISAYFRELKEKKSIDKKRVHVNLEYQSTFTAFKYTHIYRSLDRTVEFIPYNIHEIWAKKILVDNFAIVPNGKKGEVKVQNYLPIDSVDGIKAQDDKTVHLVIMGMNQMGTALGVQAALLAHFPNAHRNRNLRTTITFIDDQAVKEGEYLMGRLSALFELCRYRTVRVAEDKLISHSEADRSNWDFDRVWTDPMEKGRFRHLGENFMDIEWEFIQGNMASKELRQYLESIATDKSKVSTFAVCFNHPQKAIAAALYMPEMIYRRALQILVYQQNSFDLATKIATGEKVWKRYEKLRPFGMIDGSYTENNFDNQMAKILHFLYSNGYNFSLIEKINVELTRKINDLWSQLGIVDKLSNIDMVDSIPLKLRSLGITMDNLEKFDQKLHEGDNLELLVKAEHTRWVTERTTMGYRPLDNIPAEWGFFTDSNIDDKHRKKEKKFRKEKSRAHLDICSNTMLNVLDSGIQSNDIAVISCIPQLLKCKEWLGVMRLADAKMRASVAGKTLLDFLSYGKERYRRLALQIVRDGDNVLWMMDTTVSQAQWHVVMGNNPAPKEFCDKDTPIVNVSKLEIDDFLKILRKRTGLYFDLPTLEEWKRAALQSTSNTDISKCNTRVSRGKLDIEGPDKIRSNSDQFCNGVHLYNMLGNVWEWTKSENKNDAGCFYFCGGSWRFNILQCDLQKSYWNSFWKPVLKSDDIGFRLVWRFDVKGFSNERLENIKSILNDVIEGPVPENEEVNGSEIEKKIDLVPIKSGYFVMGAETKQVTDYPENWLDNMASDDETPHHFVKIKGFMVGSTPVTQELWNLVMKVNPKDNPSDHIGPELPQTNVSWDKIVNEFIPELRKLTGKSYRLLTEAEWEYVAKGGHDTKMCRMLTEIFENDGLSVKEKHAKAYWLMSNSVPYPLYGVSNKSSDLDLYVHATTMGVKDRDPIEIEGRKVYDMIGNVWEWCRDFYQVNFYDACIQSEEYQRNGYISNPECTNSTYAAHSFRGGSWRFDDKNCRSTSVNYWISSDADDDLGFRLALDYE